MHPHLIVKLHARYGQTDILPVNDAAQALADIAHTRTLRFDDLRHAVARLGCTVTVERGDAGTGTVSAMIDDHMLATAAGIISDARVLVERAQLKAQQHKVSYDTPIDTLSVVKDICALKQMCTQSGGLRPFGVSLLVGGIDIDGPRLFETDPTGIYFEYKAVAIGEFETEVSDKLQKSYKPDMSVDEGLKTLSKMMVEVLDKNFDATRLDCAYIKTNEKRFVKLTRDEVEKVVKASKR